MLISIIVPTYNEAGNVSSIHAGLEAALLGETWELIVVDDDSPDGTADAVRKLAGQYGNVRCIQRLQERGLCSAVQWGVQAAHGDIVVVMDGDLQHDPDLIPPMLRELRNGCDIASGSRFLSGRPIEGLTSNLRNRLSVYGNKLINLYLGVQLTDPLTGFFATSRILFLRSIPRMQADGFKIFFDLIYHNRRAAIKELPFDFRARKHGESKLQLNVLWLLLCDMISKLSGSLIPPRLVSFVGVGLIGSTVHFSFLYASLAAGAVFWLAQTIATVTAMVFNFTFNNILTYSADRLRGERFYKGLLLYSFIASFGIVANVSSAQLTYDHFKAHTFLAASVGIVIDVIWRFVVSNRLIWGQSSILKRTR
ncbi:MAG: glycosyltransferase family 2 protein [Reyranella sp.]|nr:glycosyltransferase family 2 protein [Reyranella sp.]MDP3158381.1 glycosyltransferase family 2 protein [Reyranella sp.]